MGATEGRAQASVSLPSHGPGGLSRCGAAKSRAIDMARVEVHLRQVLFPKPERILRLHKFSASPLLSKSRLEASFAIILWRWGEPRVRFGSNSRLVVTRLGRSPASRFSLLRKHRSGLQFFTQAFACSTSTKQKAASAAQCMLCGGSRSVLELYDLVALNLDVFQEWNRAMQDFMAQERRESPFEVRL